MNILLEGIICLEPADTELQPRGGGGGGGGGGGFVNSQTYRSLDSFLSLADTELQSSRSQTKNSLENLKFVMGGGSLILKLLDHLIHSLV